MKSFLFNFAEITKNYIVLRHSLYSCSHFVFALLCKKELPALQKGLLYSVIIPSTL